MCEYCAEYKSTFEDVAHNHWPECECFLLLCPNECTPSVSGIQRQHLAKHVKEDCPLTVVQCELHHAGCEVTLPRKDMADHMKEDSIAHISLLVQELIQTKQELTHTKQELTRTKQELTQKVATQSQELTRIKQELTQKVTTQGQALEYKEVSKVWAESQLEWSALGVNAGEEAEFLSGLVAPTPPHT